MTAASPLMSLSNDAQVIAETWVATFARALQDADAEALASTFLPAGWLRDVLTFAWDTRSLRGRDAIAGYLAESDRLAAACIASVAVDADPFYAPRESFAPTGQKVGIETGFTYNTRYVLGRGYAHLCQTADGTWLAVTVGMIALDLKAHPEPRDVAAHWEAAGRTWAEYKAEQRARNESAPYALIVGAGQNGLSAAARFRQMDIPTLVIEKDAAVGESWRKRYESLALHTPGFYCPLLYQPFPFNWSEYTSKDKIADWLESYAVHQHLTVWTKSILATQPSYDETTRTWEVVVDRDGKQVTLRPKHIVLATGMLGAPRTPDLSGRSSFAGTVMHAADFKTPAPFAGQRVVVVGAGNSSIDICQDLASGSAPAASVTMVQRSRTCVVSRSSVREDLAHNWTPGAPVDVGDFKFAAQPLGWFKELFRSMPDALWAREKVLHDKLRKGGLELFLGPEGGGQLLMVFERNGGYWLDKGGADLISDGRIKIKQGTAPIAFTPNGLLCDDGAELPADAVIFATGYDRIRDVHACVFGKNVVDRMCEGWGLDSEGEVKGCYRPTGHPALWYAIGDFFNCRFMSKQLAILLKAAELGLYDPVNEQ